MLSEVTVFCSSAKSSGFPAGGHTGTDVIASVLGVKPGEYLLRIRRVQRDKLRETYEVHNQRRHQRLQQFTGGNTPLLGVSSISFRLLLLGLENGKLLLEIREN